MEHSQNTLDWLKWRLEGIGASDAPIIMGKSKFKTKLQLWDEKFNKTINEDDQENTFIQDKGHRFEAWARPGFEFSTGLTWKPATFTHSSFEFLRASLDGWNSQVCEGWECKFMGKEIFEAMKNESLSFFERIPRQYLDQICQQFFVSGAKAIHLTGIIETKDIDGQNMKEAYTLKILRDSTIEEYINKTLVPAMFEFWKSVQDGIRPEAEKVDVLPITNEAFVNMVLGYELLKKEEKKLKEDAKSSSDEILGDIVDRLSKSKDEIYNHPLRNHNKMDCMGFKLTEVFGSEKVDYKAAFDAFVLWLNELKKCGNPGIIVDSIEQFPDEPSMEKYTSAGKPSFKITIPKVKTKAEATSELVDDLKRLPEEIQCNVEPVINRIDEIVANQEHESYVENWKNPITGKMPKGWKTKGDEWRIKYCIGQFKKSKNEEIKKMVDILSLRKKEKEPETIGGITFEN